MEQANDVRVVGRRPDLVGWKAIADRLGVHRNTAQKWEAEGLPVVVEKGSRIVHAFSDEVDAWRQGRFIYRGRAA